MSAAPRTLLDKIWDAHTVADLGHGMSLLLVDRNLLHDLSGLNALDALEANGLGVAAPQSHLAVPDHAISTAPDRALRRNATGRDRAERLKAAAEQHGISFIDIDDPRQGIVHIIGPELGFTQPGLVMTCGDSHTSTHGGLGALAFGIGSTDLVNVLASGCTIQKRPKRMRVTIAGERPAGVTPKDMILYLIGEVGAAGGNDHAVEYAGEAITSLDVEGRATVCNMSIEFGAKVGMIAPDDTVFDYLAGRPFAPTADEFDEAVKHWRTLSSDADAVFDREIEIDGRAIAPQMTWGTSPEHTIPITGRVPDPATAADPGTRAAW
ncbi:MAG: aconitase family protein, partial [Pseudomonadota bacterium]